MNKENILQIASLVDLTTLADTDNALSVQNIVATANKGIADSHPASVCVYGNFTHHLTALKPGIKKAIVAGHFPSGQASIDLKQNELSLLNQLQVDEIDFVINKGEIISNNFDYLHQEIQMARTAVPNKCLKVILETGILSKEQITKATEIALECHVDFLKTSTGKVEVGATLEATEIFSNQIKKTNSKTGIKVSGGIRTIEEANQYITLVSSILGEDFIHPSKMRIGASTLFTNLVEAYQQHD